MSVTSITNICAIPPIHQTVSYKKSFLMSITKYSCTLTAGF